MLCNRFASVPRMSTHPGFLTVESTLSFSSQLDFKG